MLPARLNLPRKQMRLHNFIIVTNSLSLSSSLSLVHSLLLSQSLVSDGGWSSARPLSVSISLLIPRASPFALTSLRTLSLCVHPLNSSLASPLTPPPPHSLPLSSSLLYFHSLSFFILYLLCLTRECNQQRECMDKALSWMKLYDQI